MVNWEEGMEAIVPRVRMPMYRVSVEEIRWEAVFPGSEPFMLMLHAGCSLFGSGPLLTLLGNASLEHELLINHRSERESASNITFW